MYKVIIENHPKFNLIVQIKQDRNGYYNNPFHAVNAALTEKRKLSDQQSNVVLIIFDQIMTPKQALYWANEEYKFLLKCFECSNILPETLFTNNISSEFFCSQNCANKSYFKEIAKYDDEEEIDYL